MHPLGVQSVGDLAPNAELIQSFGKLYDELFPLIYGYVRLRVGDPEATQDLTAQVFERALSRLASVQHPERIRAWLFTIARNLVRGRYRRPDRFVGLAAAAELKYLWADSAETVALRREDRRRLIEYLARLTERERDVIGLRFAAGLTNREIAQVLHLSEANVGQILHRAVRKLRQQFAETETPR